METIDAGIFQIVSFSYSEDKIAAVLSINVDSEILKGHFPGRPVVPGACMLQSVKDLLEKALDKPLRLKKAGNLKFISMITPDMKDLSAEISYKVIENEIIVTANLSADGKVCFKLLGGFV